MRKELYVEAKKPRLFLQSTVVPDNRFEIMHFNKETGVARLKGKYAEFDETLNEEKMQKYHYVIERVPQ